MVSSTPVAHSCMIVVGRAGFEAVAQPYETLLAERLLLPSKGQPRTGGPQQSGYCRDRLPTNRIHKTSGESRVVSGIEQSLDLVLR